LKIMEYAQAIGDPNAVYRDLDAARQAGYPDVIAPPTFAVVVALPASVAAVRDTAPGTGHPVIVHVEQRFEYARPIRAGDVLHAESVVTGIRELRGVAMVTTRTEIRAADGEQICTAWATLAKLPSADQGLAGSRVLRPPTSQPGGTQPAPEPKHPAGGTAVAGFAFSLLRRRPDRGYRGTAGTT
jgi:acyl dehydratase